MGRRGIAVTVMIGLLALVVVRSASAQFLTRPYILQNAATAAGGGTVAHVGGFSLMNVQVVNGTGASPVFVVQFEQSLNDIHYTATLCYPLHAGAGVTTASAPGHWRCNVSGSLWFRARLTSYVGAGPITVYGVLMAGGTHAASLMRPGFSVARLSEVVN